MEQLLEGEQGGDCVRHCHKRDPDILAHKTGIRFSLRSGMQHLGCVIARATTRKGHRANQPGEPNRPKIHGCFFCIRRKLPVVMCIVSTEVLTIQFVASVHRNGLRPAVLTYFARTSFYVDRGESVHSNGTWKEELNRRTLPARLFDGKPEKRHRAFHVDAVCRLGRKFCTGGEQRGKMVNRPDLILARQSLKQAGVQDVTNEGGPAKGAQ